jgi:hypothetical protein
MLRLSQLCPISEVKEKMTQILSRLQVNLQYEFSRLRFKL